MYPPPPAITGNSAIPEDRNLKKYPKVLSTEVIDWRAIGHGENFAVMERITFYTMDDGTSGTQTSRYTVLGNGMHYLENGEWKESQDVIEVFPGGAVARKGPNRTIFSSELNAEAVFDMETSAGDRIRGGVRSIQIRDAADGASRVIAQVRENAPGELLPPNRIIYRDAFNGLKADVLYVWKHNQFSQNVILMEQPALPQGMDPLTARLEVVTEFVEAPAPSIKRKFRRINQIEIVDDAFIEFGNLLVVPGRAISTEGVGFSVDSPNFLKEDGIYVSKEWIQAENERGFLIESIDWMEAQEALENLPPGRQAENFIPSNIDRALAGGRIFVPSVRANPKYPIKMAEVDYVSKGFLIDYTTLPSTSSSRTFETGETYYVTTSGFYTGGTTTFEPGAVIKQAPNASNKFLTYGPLVFPSGSLDYINKVIFTSKNDDCFGEIIDGSTGEPDYDADPSLWIYYVDFENTIENAWFRWAEHAVKVNTNPLDDVTHDIENSIFQFCNYAIYVDSNSEVAFVGSSNKKCNVNEIKDGTGTYSGSLGQAIFCLDTEFEALDRFEGGNDPPDAMGAIGDSHYVELVNSKIAIYDKDDGSKLESEDFDVFFKETTHDLLDPRIVFDFHTEKWIACALDRQTGDIKIAISSGSDPSNLTSTNSWNIYTAEISTSDLEDFPTLGVDKNGIYIAVHFYNLPPADPIEVSNYAKLIAINSAETTGYTDIDEGTDIHIQHNLSLPDPDEDGVSDGRIIQPALNFDSISTSNPAWFIAKSKGTGATDPGDFYYFTMSWDGNNDPVWPTNTWSNSITLDGYYDLDFQRFWAIPQKGTTDLNIDLAGSRFQMAVIRNSYLWTCHHIGLDGGDYDYDSTTNAVDRIAVQWLKYSVNYATPALSASAEGRIYDEEQSDPVFYFYPSLAVNSNNDMLIGFCGSSPNHYFSSFYYGKTSGGSTPSSPIPICYGTTALSTNRIRWGDYTYASVDPDDNDTFWTITLFAKEVEVAPGTEVYVPDWQTGVAKISP